MATVEELPNDIELLKRLILEERREREEAIEQVKQKATAEIDQAVKEASTKQLMAAILRRYYGPSLVRSFDPRQLLLVRPTGGRQRSARSRRASKTKPAKSSLTRRVRKRHKHGRQQLPEHLERIEIEHDLDDKACPACGNERCRMGAKRSASSWNTSQPASRSCKHICHKYACNKCDEDGYNPNIATSAKKPPQPIDKGLCLGRVCWRTSSPASWATTCRSTGWRSIFARQKAPRGPQHDVCLDAVRWRVSSSRWSS